MFQKVKQKFWSCSAVGFGVYYTQMVFFFSPAVQNGLPPVRKRRFAGI